MTIEVQILFEIEFIRSHTTGGVPSQILFTSATPLDASRTRRGEPARALTLLYGGKPAQRSGSSAFCLVS
ncbi:hypothetical protein QUB80_05700 [Chlorogloeopsis sp. ULAP01]|uniref:hypothetical protein n=1 Tax=Chlorogloeopsis sp. ULAP01 TaxID=3056483 RepID=UPI0025AA6B20|nr:hypothetical protein [Chlorogloeopsis sp. ULAP01]MDM9380194.1 hypothetical protein [Chlorogloeopsis sp. ULAP01]